MKKKTHNVGLEIGVFFVTIEKTPEKTQKKDCRPKSHWSSRGTCENIEQIAPTWNTNGNDGNRVGKCTTKRVWFTLAPNGNKKNA